MKLNLGSNDVIFEGFINVDIRKIDSVNLVTDVLTLNCVRDNSIEQIVAHNILEHFADDKTDKILGSWLSKLAPGGSIEIGVPDGEVIFNRYLRGEASPASGKQGWPAVIHSIFGNLEILKKWHGEDYERYMHHTLFCETYLREKMTHAGFKKITKVEKNHPDNVTLKGIK